MNTNKVRSHETNRKTAAVVGVLFIIGTVQAYWALLLQYLFWVLRII